MAVVGAGLAGVATAYELAALGCSVQVFERGGSVAEQASFAGSAVLAPFLPGLAEAPDAPLTWRWRRWRAGRRSGDGAACLAALSLMSLARTAELRRDLGLDDESADGLLVALSDTKQLAAAEARLEGWRALGLAVDLLDGEHARQREPGLNGEAPLAGALALPAGGVGNARLFTQQLRQQAQRRGVEFRFHTTVRAVTADGMGLSLRHEYTPPAEAPARAQHPRDAGDTLPQMPGTQDERFDAVVLCCGLEAARLLSQRLPLAAQVESSVTAPLRLLEAHPHLGPQVGLVDPGRGLAVARIGQRVRVAGAPVVMATRTPTRAAADFDVLHRGLQHWFPGSVLHQQVQQGHSRRAVVADGLPLLGASSQPGLWLNLSPGGGWGLACGSAQVLAQQVAGLAPAFDVTPLGPQRLA